MDQMEIGRFIAACRKEKKLTQAQLALLVGIMVCLICDLAISGGLTWSPIPVSSIILAWLIAFQLIVKLILWKRLGEAPLDVWDLLSALVLLILAFAALLCDCGGRK